MYLKDVTARDTRMGEQLLAPPQEPVTIQDGTSRVSGSVNALNNAGVELNNAELRANSQKPVWKAKQQLLGLLKVCQSHYSNEVSFTTP